jgi:hypothetical protein
LAVKEDCLVGWRWYTSSMKRKIDISRGGAGKICNTKRHIWYTHDAFEVMFNCVYVAMVEEGVCRLLSEPVRSTAKRIVWKTFAVHFRSTRDGDIC